MIDRIDEKVSKKEIDEALKNSNILVGAEFEFKCDELEKIQKEYDKANKEYRKALKDFIDYKIDHKNWQDDDYRWERKLDLRIAGLKGGLMDMYDERETLNDTKEIDFEIEKNKEAIEELESELDNRLGAPEPPDMPRSIIDYDENWNDSMNNYFAIDPYIDDIPEPNEPMNVNDLDNDDDWEIAVENVLNDFPIKNIKAEWSSSKTLSPGSKSWRYEKDATIDDIGIEIKSPPMPISDFIKTCPKIFTWINKNGYTDDSCGFHIHMSLSNTPDLERVVDLVKLTFFTDEEYIFKFFDSRKSNENVLSVKDNIMKKGGVSKGDLDDLLDVKKIKNKFETSHYNAINWEGLDDSHGHIEFRYIGGKNYEKKWDNIRTILGQYSHNLSLSCDPDYKRKEYLKKVIILLGKLELKYLETRLEIIGDWKTVISVYHADTDGENKKLMKWLNIYTKNLKKKYETIKSLYGKTNKVQIDYSSKSLIIRDLEKKIIKFKPSQELMDWIRGG